MASAVTEPSAQSDLDVARRLDAICDDFEEAFSAGSQPQIEEYLNRVSATQRAGLLTLLLPVELELRREQADIAPLADYQRRFDEHAELVERLYNEGNDSRAAVAATETKLADLPAELRRELRGYRLIRQIGQGGMGAVYLAKHKSLHRQAAVKLLPTESLLTEEAIARFRREMEAVGQLDHPNIVRAYDASDEHGQFFLAMEYLRGADLNKLVRCVGRLRIADACEIVRQVAMGLQHAHERGLTHRDIKPSNLMLTQQGGVKILDFGLARLAASQMSTSDVTLSGQVVGTLMYIAPEQCGDAHQADIRSDLYGLGCTLYFLLTARRPYEGEQYNNIVKLIQAHATEMPPSLVESGVKAPPGLELLLRKLTAKNPNDRFQTPAELVRALKRFCRESHLAVVCGAALQEPATEESLPQDEQSTDSQGVLAYTQPFITTHEEDFSFRKWDEHRKHIGQPTQRTVRGAFRIALALLGLMLTGILGTLIYINTGHGQLEIFVDSPHVQLLIDESPRQDFQLVTRQGQIRLRVVVRSGKHTLEVRKEGFTSYTDEFRLTRDGEVSLTARFTPLPVPPTSPERPTSADSERGTPLAQLTPTHYLETPNVIRISYSPDGMVLASASGDGGPLTLWDPKTGERIEQLADNVGVIPAVAFSPDGRWLAWAENHQGKNGIEPSINIWSRNDGQVVATLEGHPGCTYTLAFSEDGSRLVSAGNDGVVKVWESESGELLRTYRHDWWVWDSDFQPNSDDHRFATISGDGTARLWQPDTDAAAAVLRGHRGKARGVAFAPDGRRLITSGDDRTIRIWDVTTHEELQTLTGSRAGVWSVDVSPDGRFIASGGTKPDVALRLWDFETGELLESLPVHRSVVWSVKFSPDGSQVATGSADGIRIWTLQSTVDSADGRLQELLKKADSLPLNPDDPAVEVVWQRTLDQYIEKLGTPAAVESAKLLRQIPSPFDRIRREDVDEYELWFAAGGDPDNVPIELAGIIGEGLTKHWDRALTVDWSPDQRTFVSGGEDNRAIIWDVQTGRAIRMLPLQTDFVRCVRFSPDGTLLVTCTGLKSTESNERNREINLWNSMTGELVRTLSGVHTSTVRGLNFSPDGKLLASAGYDNRIVLWDLTDETSTVLEGHEDLAFCVDFDPLRPRLASSSRDGTVRLWDTETGEALTVLKGHTGDVEVVTFSEDGNLLASGAADQSITIWDVTNERNVRQSAILQGHQAQISSLAFQPGGHLLASGCAYGELRLWNVQTHQPVDDRPLPFHPWRNDRGIASLAFSSDGKRLLAARRDYSVRLWDVDSMEASLGAEWPPAGLIYADLDPRGEYMVSAGKDGSAWLWNILEGNVLHKLEETTNNQRGVAARSNPTRFLTSTQGDQATGRSLRFWSVDGRYEYGIGGDLWPHRLDLSPNGKSLCSFSWRPEHHVSVLDTETGQKRFEITFEENPVDVIRFHPDGQQIASAAATSIHVWDARDGSEISPLLSDHSGKISDLEYSANGCRLYSLSDAAKELFSWDMTSDPPRVTSSLIPADMAHEMGTLSGMAVSPDGTQVSVADMSGIIRIWDTSINRVVKTITMEGVRQRFRDIFFAPDSRHLVVPDVNGVIYVFRLSPNRSSVAQHLGLPLPPAPEFPFVEQTAQDYQQACAQALGIPVQLENSIGMTFRLIPPGTFVAGHNYKGNWNNAKRQVTLTRPFYISAFETRQKEYEAVTRENPSEHHADDGSTDDHPVEMVSQTMAGAFCEALTGRSEEGSGLVYRLPTEAEWEYAARAGVSSYFTTGQTITPADANFAPPSDPPSDHEPITKTVGQYTPNAWGLFDVHGNVEELTGDHYSPLTKDPVTDPRVGSESGRNIIYRGGTCADTSNYGLRLYWRRRHNPSSQSPRRGFRVVLEVTPQLLQQLQSDSPQSAHTGDNTSPPPAAHSTSSDETSSRLTGE